MTDDLVKRLRGEYRVPITDGLGAVGSGSEPDNPFTAHPSRSGNLPECSDPPSRSKLEPRLFTENRLARLQSKAIGRIDP